MPAYIIRYGTTSPQLTAYAYPTRAAAEAAMSTGPGKGRLIETERDADELPTSELVAIYNGLAESPVKKFESRAVGIKRLFAVLTGVPEAPIPTQKEKPKMETQAQTNTRGRQPSVPSTAKIKLKKTENPKRPGSAAAQRYALYRDGMTVGEFLAAGGTMSDILHDRGKDFIAVG